ncbi:MULTISPECIES: aldehyde dehydrogenase family protein [Staphylococcus]|uniref:Putative aldehyde dehydrogenase AldA n=1 Tax=Staphylococcus xylosus TaxID=1288 RepID=A0A418IRM3_STAXY|nr:MULTISPECIES: aldehyde dehydrogenase family protein [Staphylococcus]MBF0812637.1 aldehyde dehydrogenase [Staphylococcus saprophyticus]MDW8562654.1 aldehyde dehydrogenase family protein [Staphylococcus sp. KG4-3]NQD99064.1 aldehyde dehydrogenase [Staphylococcus xylosus]PTI09313.1 aldehyde dehydrogenase [Staphylococcus xylosus]RIN12580.1 aldehyde dehydrogenase [Staphylococcus xylosus]
MIYTNPNESNAKYKVKEQYSNFIDGSWTEPQEGEYFDNISPITGENYSKVPRSSQKDVDLAVKAAKKAQVEWGKKSLAERSQLLLDIADRVEENLEYLAVIETFDNGKPVRETLAADLPLVVDHFRYFAGVIRAEEGGISQIDNDTVAYHYKEPLGVIGQIIPWNFPLLMATWKIAPAIVTGNAVVLKPAEQTPVSILHFIEIIEDILPKGLINVINGFGNETGEALATHKGINKVAFTGETTTGKIIMKNASDNVIPVTLELGGKSPNIFYKDIMDEDDEFLDKAVEGLVMFALNQGEVCTCPSRALVQEDIYDEFIKLCIDKVNKIKLGNPLDDTTMVGAQTSNEQQEKIKKYLDIGKDEGAEILVGGNVRKENENLKNGFYIEPTIFKGNQNMRVFQEEIFGPVLSVATFKDNDEALAMANDTIYGLGAGIWTRNQNIAYRAGRGIQAGRVWVNNYHTYPAHAAFGGYKMSGIGRENHLMMLEHYQQTKNLLVSYDTKPTGLF